MKLSSLNEWLTLLASIGVLVGIIVVAVELRQTQTAMQADASTVRAQMAIQHQNISRANNLSELRAKVARGDELSNEEIIRADEWYDFMLRYFENLHYQSELGVLDSEIWQANLTAIEAMCNDQLFQRIRGWPSESTTRFRKSFVDLVMSPCE